VEQVSHHFQVVDEGGIPVAVTSAVPKYEAPLFNYEETVRLSEDEERPESLLYRPSDILCGDDGRFYVEDVGNSRIAVFDSDGQFSHAIGREGEGPGEFRRLELLSVSGGHVLVYDGSLRRASSFRTDGTLLQTHASPVSDYSVRGLYPLSEGRYLVITSRRQGGINRDTVTTPVAMVVTASGDTLASLTTKSFTMVKMVFLQDLNMGLQIQYPLAARGGFAYKADQGLLAFHTGQPEIVWYGLDGSVARKVRMDIQPEPVTEAERTAILERSDKRIEAAESDRMRAMAKATRENVVIPQFKPYWSDVVLDDSAFLWLEEVYDASLPPAERDPTAHMILSPEGEFLGRTTLPHSRGYISKGCFVAFQQAEGSDATEIVVYRIVPAVAGISYP
jgi:hypothetical protein